MELRTILRWEKKIKILINRNYPIGKAKGKEESKIDQSLRLVAMGQQ